ncbi:MAG: glycosyltransferase family 39 protein [Acidobacteria bacterium]|nr:glycosyltransferase family 39 protein [Acidobacteriota bacterium]
MEAQATRASGGWAAAARAAAQALVASRLLVFAAGAAGAAALRPWSGRELDFDPWGLVPDSVLVGPLARWDSVWVLSVATDGYGYEARRTAFFPLYPLLTGLGGDLLGSPLAAGVLVSLVALLVSLMLVHRLAEIELGPREAGVAVWLLALFPASVYLSAVYSESLFLALTLGAALAARTGIWPLAGALGGLAAATRSVGILVLVLLVGLWLDRRAGSRRRAADLAWLALVPLGLVAYALWLEQRGFGAFSFLEVQATWGRVTAGPWSGVADGLVAGGQGLGTLVTTGAAPLAAHNLMLACWLLLGVAGVAGALRVLPWAYGLYMALILLAALSSPVDWQPLLSLPRVMLVCFPLFLWLASALAPGRIPRMATYAVSALALATWAALFSAWTWLA